jgi:hypothetical protein
MAGRRNSRPNLSLSLTAETIIRDLRRRLTELEDALVTERRARRDSEDECARAVTQVLTLEVDLAAAKEREEAAARQWIALSNALDEERKAAEYGKRINMSGAFRIREIEAKEEAMRERTLRAAALVVEASEQIARSLPPGSIIPSTLRSLAEELADAEKKTG